MITVGPYIVISVPQKPVTVTETKRECVNAKCDAHNYLHDEYKYCPACGSELTVTESKTDVENTSEVMVEQNDSVFEPFLINTISDAELIIAPFESADSKYSIDEDKLDDATTSHRPITADVFKHQDKWFTSRNWKRVIAFLKENKIKHKLLYGAVNV